MSSPDNPGYPRLTPLSDYPLHGWDYGGTDYACQRPEDPTCTQFDMRCNACLLAAEAYLANFGDVEVMWRQDANIDERPVLLSWLIERSLYWLYEHDQ